MLTAWLPFIKGTTKGYENEILTIIDCEIKEIYKISWYVASIKNEHKLEVEKYLIDLLKLEAPFSDNTLFFDTQREKLFKDAEEDKSKFIIYVEFMTQVYISHIQGIAKRQKLDNYKYANSLDLLIKEEKKRISKLSWYINA